VGGGDGDFERQLHHATSVRENINSTGEKTMASSNVRVICTESSFNSEVIQSTLPVIVHFFAKWAGPCKQLQPSLDALADEYIGKMVFVNVDVDENESLAMEYEVTTVPAVFAIKHGEVVDKFTGYKDKQDLVAVCKKIL
jgi:thioredoxin 1